MKRTISYALGFVCLILIACSDNDDRSDDQVEIPNFNFPQTVNFEEYLSAYDIFADTFADLKPTEDFHLLELSSILFTDYAHKQRLVKVPEGKQMTRLSDGSIDFPDGTVLVKTFFYYNDERDISLGRKIIETRLLIKESNTWNVATYLWNQAQTDASLALNGSDIPISWIDTKGNSLSNLYHVPAENECITCHQSSATMIPLGPSLRNLNRVVERNGTNLNQIHHLQSLGILHDFEISQVPQIVDYNNLNASLSERGRAYLAMNCAHCHHPEAWQESAEHDFDFRYDVSLRQTGILFEKDKIIEAVLDRDMPFIGTSILDQEGINLIVEFIESL